MNASGGSLTALVIRSETPLHEASIARVIAEVDPELAIARFEPMERVVANSVGPQRLVTIVLGLFAALALLLASVGVYGVISYLAALRMHEIGIRVALGAQRADVRRLVFGQGLSLALLGVGAGIVGALGLTRFLSSWLYGVQPTDAVALASASVILIAVTLLACYLPARRATKVDPIVALRNE
jgi:putative ABC transport system permease protein